MQSLVVDMTITERKDTDACTTAVTQNVLDILSVIFEFKIAASWHIARLIFQMDRKKYAYKKLNIIWRAGYIESFRPETGIQRASTPVYYLLSQKGLDALREGKAYTYRQLRRYPQQKTILQKTFFDHDSTIVELASQEAKIASKNLSIRFKGESNSVAHDYRGANNVEVFTPDYTALYAFGDRMLPVFTEFERTPKSKRDILRKVERYLEHLRYDARQTATLRFIFQDDKFEQAFWITILTRKPQSLERMKIMTTHIPMIKTHEHYREPIYASASFTKLTRNEDGLTVDISQRIKLFAFL